MKTTQIIIAASVILLLLGYFGCSISYQNQEVDLRTRIEAQQESNAVVYDKVWKVLQSQAGVADKYQQDFAQLYENIMDARYKDDGSGQLAKFITEANPQFDGKLFSTLMISIESLRGEFANEQKKLIDLCREYNAMIQKFPGSVFLSGKTPMQAKLVTSAKTKKTIETGEENEVDLFPAKQTPSAK
jgi:hypothetical protein